MTSFARWPTWQATRPLSRWSTRSRCRRRHPPPPPLPPLTDTVNGSGFGRNLYVLASVNGAGASSAPTPATGPIYTVTVNPSRAPVLYKVTAAGDGAYIVAWALDGSPDVAGDFIYRAPAPADLADLRWFGADQQPPSDR